MSISQQPRLTHAHARENLLSGVARFPRTASGRSMMREAYQLSFMRHPSDPVPIMALDWDVLAEKLSLALMRRS